jgi:hypothetical protein
MKMPSSSGPRWVMTSRMRLSTAASTIRPDLLENAIPFMPHIEIFDFGLPIADLRDSRRTSLQINADNADQNRDFSKKSLIYSSVLICVIRVNLWLISIPFFSPIADLRDSRRTSPQINADNADQNRYFSKKSLIYSSVLICVIRVDLWLS